MNIPISGTASDDVAVTVLQYRVREMTGGTPENPTWGSWGSPVAIDIPSHSPGVPFSWSGEIPDIGVGSYQVEFRAADAEDNDVTILRTFHVVSDVAPPDALTGITMFTYSTAPSETNGTDARIGFRFLVGDDDVMVNQLGFYGASTNNEHIQIHRHSDGSLVADAVVASAAGAWRWGAIAEGEIVLEANTMYVISSSRTDGFGRLVYLVSPDDMNFDPSVSFSRVVYGTQDTDGVSAGMPGTVFEPPDAEWAEDYTCVAFRHNV